MAVKFYIDGDRAVLIVRTHGRYSSRDLLACLGTVVGDARFRRDHRVLLDFRGSAFVEASDRLRDVARFLVSHADLQRCALVADDDAGWGLARMFVALAGDDGNRVRPFKAFAAATRWLGCPDLPDHALLGTGTMPAVQPGQLQPPASKKS